MKTFLKVLAGLVGLLIIVVIAGIVYLNSAFPKVYKAEDITIELTPERLERGAYIVNHVSMCMDCHSEVKDNLFSSPVISGTEGKGGRVIHEQGVTIHVRNITPASLKDWTDGEIVRAITEGIDKDNKPLAPIMPYTEYKYMTKEDVYSVVAYLRALPPIENEVPPSEIGFPLNLIFPTVPDSATPMQKPDTNDTVASGRYLARIAGCYFCHTPFKDGKNIEDEAFSGGHAFSDPKFGTVRSANITPDMETGIGSWTREMFIARFKSYADSAGRNIPLGGNVYQTAMPWTLLAGMSEKDLGAIYDYLRTVRAIPHKFERYTSVVVEQ